MYNFHDVTPFIAPDAEPYVFGQGSFYDGHTHTQTRNATPPRPTLSCPWPRHLQSGPYFPGRDDPVDGIPEDDPAAPQAHRPKPSGEGGPTLILSDAPSDLDEAADAMFRAADQARRFILAGLTWAGVGFAFAAGLALFNLILAAVLGIPINAP